MTERCPSTFVVVVASDLVLTQCLLDKGHHGKCGDDQGNDWIRVAEHLRERKINSGDQNPSM